MQKFEIVACDRITELSKCNLETGMLAEQASGAAVVRSGDSVVFAAVVGSKEPREGNDFLPLTVDYFERPMLPAKFPVVSLNVKDAPQPKRS